MSDIKLRVEGMHCGGCENTVRAVVGALPNVTSVDADHQTGTVEVHGQGVDLDAVRAAIIDVGYEVLPA